MWKFCQIISVLAMVASTIAEDKSFPLDLNTFTTEQLATIEEFRNLVKQDLPVDYMQEDVYLAKWLLERNFEVNDAQKFLQDHLKWRREEKVDNILKENWRDMNAMFPYSRNTVDKKGRPILFFHFGDWDISKFVSKAAENSDRLARYFIKMLEESEADVRARRAAGEAVTQFQILISVGEINQKHFCIQCMYFYKNIASTLSYHFPHATFKNVFVNVPYPFQMVYSFVGVLPNASSNDSTDLFGQNKDQWMSALLEYIEENQIPKELLNETLPVKDNMDGLLQWNKEL